ncbi:MAG TPA: hypothetical protein VKW77_03060, partial [Acidimicrobiales bacterium]|nr:hypothetical protein [Acidimicrobiales bacterium]
MNRPLRVLLTGGDGQLGRDLRDVLAGRTPDGGEDPALGSGAGAGAGLGGRAILPPVHPGTFEVHSTDIADLDIRDRTAVLAAADAL